VEVAETPAEKKKLHGSQLRYIARWGEAGSKEIKIVGPIHSLHEAWKARGKLFFPSKKREEFDHQIGRTMEGASFWKRREEVEKIGAVKGDKNNCNSVKGTRS